MDALIPCKPIAIFLLIINYIISVCYSKTKWNMSNILIYHTLSDRYCPKIDVRITFDTLSLF